MTITMRRSELKRLLSRMQTACKSEIAYLQTLKEVFEASHPEYYQYVCLLEKIHDEFVLGVLELDKKV